ncbi:putative MFS multidrug transporter [Cryphonectria parasitica EP155]|uniref:MFS multidrug transporter n=1 Tax=Cryphonectria parasitica (strain ATCC 38755 / EP155) TaxID=660469 RepID=A0A9P4XYW3_CRYP1|nr:putative MFS multidrug transporter [Cryphonectria parasitica EP155]KAF3763882.1 putative MFS multidrug transporter [Cryphonectria parasitica EP155]
MGDPDEIHLGERGGGGGGGEEEGGKGDNDVHDEIEYRYLTFSTDLSPAEPRILSQNDNNQPPVPPRPPHLSQFSDPQGWSRTRKSFVTWLSCLSTFFTTWTPGAYTAGSPQYQTEWGVSNLAVYCGITVFTLCFAVAPMVLASLSEITGRRPLFVTAGVVFAVSQLGSAVTQSFAGMLVTRALAGMSCSVFSAVVGGVISDIYVAKDRNTAMAIFTGAALAGTGVGPLVSSVIEQHLSWRWIFYLQTITCSLMVAALCLFFPETRGNVLLSRKASVLNAWYDAVQHSQSAPPPPSFPSSPSAVVQIRWRVKADEDRASVPQLVKTSLLRPIQLLVTESVVFWFSIWMSFAWSILYMTFEIIPLVFERVYGFSAQAAGLCFTPVIVASLLGTVAAVWQDGLLLGGPDVAALTTTPPPEIRLVFACFQALLLPAGLFWLGATSRPSIPWVVPVLSIGSTTLGIFTVYLAVFNYLADTYHTYASSAIAAQSFTRNVFAACLPLAVEPMFNTLGPTGSGCLLGSIGLALGVVPWVLVLWGPRIRARSPILSALAIT